MLPDSKLLEKALRCRCPQCGKGDLYEPGFFTFTLKNKCDVCGLDLAKNDSADGPAVFLIFILGGLLVPLALIVDAVFSPALWLHAIIWTLAALGLTLGMLKPLKAYVIALQFKHRRSDWEK